MAKRLLCLALRKSVRQADGTIYVPELLVNHNKDTFERMNSDGSRYENLGRHLGSGIALVLGTELPEGYWTKDLPKSGKQFERAVNAMKDGSIARFAEQHSVLCNRLVDWYLEFVSRGSIVSNPQLRSPDPSETYFPADESVPFIWTEQEMIETFPSAYGFGQSYQENGFL